MLEIWETLIFCQKMYGLLKVWRVHAWAPYCLRYLRPNSLLWMKISTTGWLTAWLVSVISWQRFVERKPVRIRISASKRRINQSSSPKQCDVLLDLDSNWTTIQPNYTRKPAIANGSRLCSQFCGKLLALARWKYCNALQWCINRRLDKQ